MTNGILSTFTNLRNIDQTTVTCFVNFVTPQRTVQVYPCVLTVVQQSENRNNYIHLSYPAK